MTVIYPDMEKDLNNPRFLNLLMAHLDACKDVCDHFGISTTLQPYVQNSKVTGFTVKSYRDPSKSGDDEYDFPYDPMWDDGTDFDEIEKLYSGIDEEMDGVEKKDPYPEIVDKIPDDDDTIINITKRWVDKVMADMGICPFTTDAETSGLPVGPVFYKVDRCTGMEDCYEVYWKEVIRVEQNPEKELSTTLLILPEFCMDNVEMFESFSNTLTQPLAALGIEELLQLVFFHPQWSFRDGGERTEGGEAANYARRSAWPMINILRTKQVRAAQKGIPTGLVYKQNEKTLTAVGVEKLETMLRKRDWSEVADLKVNRREYDALRLAQDYQEAGSVVSKQDDMSVQQDATPAANRVEKRQVEEGDLVKVLVQALERRLGIGEEGSSAAQLTGPETSATAMAADFLMKELDKIVDAKDTLSEVEVEVDDNKEKSFDPKDESTRRREERIEKARRAMLEDLQGETEDSSHFDRGDAETEVIFGRGGILDGKDDNTEESPLDFSL